MNGIHTNTESITNLDSSDCDENGDPIVQGKTIRAEDDVKRVQEWTVGINNADGIWGDQSTRGFKDKLTEIQQANGLNVTGKLNSETKKAIRDQLGDELADAIERLEDRGITNYQLSVPEDCPCIVEGSGDFISPDVKSMMPDLPSHDTPDQAHSAPKTTTFPEKHVAPESPAVEPDTVVLQSKSGHQEYSGELTVDDIYANLRISSGLGGNTIGLDEGTLRSPALEGLGTLIFNGAKDMAFSDVMRELRDGTGVAADMSVDDRSALLDRLEPLENHLAENVNGTSIEASVYENPESGSFEVEIDPEMFANEGVTFAGEPSILQQLTDAGMNLWNALFEKLEPTTTAALNAENNASYDNIAP